MQRGADQIEIAIVRLLMAQPGRGLDELMADLDTEFGIQARCDARDALDALIARGVVEMRLLPRAEAKRCCGCGVYLTWEGVQDSDQEAA